MEAADGADLGLCEKVIAATKPIIGVGPRGLRPSHLKPLFQGFFIDDEAREAWPLFLDLGRRYLDGAMPPWVRRTLNKELLTPLVKAAPPPGRKPDCRPAKGRDMDISGWTKGQQRKHCKEVSRQPIP